jgi:hypothetical protein
MAVKTPVCLIGAGVLGHTWVATVISKETDAERIMCQASYGADAVRSLDNYTKEQRGHIYERLRSGKWVKRTRGYALLDQAPGRPYEPAIADEGGAA